MLQHAGFSRTTWSNYENGLTEPSINGLLVISHFFGVSIDDLLLKEMKIGERKIPEKKSKPKMYSNDNFSLLNEPSPSLNYVMDELKKLRQDVDVIKKSKVKKK
jgi:transcriptional regulator with XRE-family HTH domain